MRNLRKLSQVVPQFLTARVPPPFHTQRRRCPGMLLFLLVLSLGENFIQAQERAFEDPPLGTDAGNPVLIRGIEATGVVDVGYRSIAGFQGSQDYYRSVVNLGNGPRLLFANLDFQSPLGTKKYFDKLHFDASAWGGDPYNTMRVYAQKAGVYEFNFNYRNVDYYNYIPTFANPLLLEGVLVGQHSYDTAIRTIDIDLTLRPGKKISPYLAYSRSSGFGPGITTFTGAGNEFPVNNQVSNSSNYYRGGVTLNLRKTNLIFEQGIVAFKDDQTVYWPGGVNTGNRKTPVLGQTTYLDQLDEYYHVRGTTPVSRFQIVSTPWQKLTVTGRFVYTQPNLNFDYNQRSAGNFVSFEVARIFTGDVTNAVSDGKLPHILGNVSVEYRPWERVRIVDNLITDRFHTDPSSTLGRTLTGTDPLSDPPDPDGTFSYSTTNSNRLAVNLNQNQLEGIIDLTSRLSVRGGYRYVWSDTQLVSFNLEGENQAISINRNVAIAGFNFRLQRKASLGLDFESGQGSRVFSRTDILDYQKVRIRGRYKIWEPLVISGSYFLLNYQNGQRDLDYNFNSYGYTLSATVSPKGGKRFMATLDYSKGDLNSDILILIPQTLTTSQSIYIENSNFGNLNLDFGIYRGFRFNLGGTVMTTTGNRPLNYYQPHAGFLIPLGSKLYWTTEWRYYDFNDKEFAFQDFRVHLITAGIRFRY